MGSKVGNLLGPVGSLIATATGNPELIPLISGAGALAGGQGIGGAVKAGALGLAGQELGGALGNEFPDTFGGTFGTGGNSLTDLLGTTSGAGSLAGAGTIGGDISGLLNGSGGSSLSSFKDPFGTLANGGSSVDPSNLFPNGGSVFQDPSTFGNGGFGLNTGTPSSQIAQELASGTGYTPGAVSAPNYAIGGGGASAFGSGAPASTGSSLSKYLLPALGAASSLGSNFAAQGALTKATDSANAQLSPYLQTGGAAEGTLGSYLGLPGSSGSGGSAQSILAASPGYQFQLDQGNRALAAQQAAAGSLNSGAAEKAAESFGTGLANQTGQQYYQNLANTAGQGLSAAGQYGTNTTALGTAKGGADIATGNTLSQLLSGIGGKRVTGYNPTTGQPIYGYG